MSLSDKEKKELLLYKSLMDSVSDVIFFKDIEGKYVIFNNSFLELTGLTKKDFKCKTDDELWDKETAEIIKNDDLEIIKTKKAISSIREFVDYKGTTTFMDSRKVPILDNKENCIGIAGVGRIITKEVKTQKELQASYDNQKAILNNLPYMAWIKDKKEKYIYLNEGYAEFCGVTIEDCIGKTDLEIHPKELAEAYIKDDKQVMKTRQKFQTEEIITTQKGPRWCKVFKSPLMDENGNVYAATGVAIDITDEKNYKEKLQLSFENQKAILDNLPFMAWLKDKQSKYIYVNEAFRKLCNKELDEMISKTDLDFFPKDLAESYRNDDFKIMKSKQKLRTEEIIETSMGRRWFETYKMPLLDPDNKSIGTTGFARDITDERKAKQELKAGFEKQKAILDNLPFGAWLKDKNSIYIYSNEPFAKLSGNSPKDLIGKIDNDFFPADLANAYRKDDKEIIRTKKQKRIEEAVQTPTGRRWFETYKTPILDDNGDVIGTTGFARDITEQKQLELIKNEFITVVSKELKSPLSSIKGSIQLITSGALGNGLSDSMLNLLKIADNSTSRLINLVNDILDIENIEKGKMDFDFQPYNATKLVKEAIKNNQEYVEKFNLKISLNSPNQDVKIKVDKPRFLQVMKNLIINAVNFSPQNSSIDINISEIDSYIRIEVKDYGPGIPEGKREIVFHKFAQEDLYDKETQNVTGLGLSLSKSILNRMQGYVDFTSKKGKGTTFYFDIPKYQ